MVFQSFTAKEVSMANKVTIQDIADALGISRNTVSKAINNTGVLADSTRDKVLQKAMEMGYKQFSYISIIDNRAETTAQTPKKNQEIALLTSRFLDDAHFLPQCWISFRGKRLSLATGFPSTGSSRKRFKRWRFRNHLTGKRLPA